MNALDWARVDSRLRLGDRKIGSSLMLRMSTQAVARVHLFDVPVRAIPGVVDYSLCGRFRKEYTKLFGRYLLADAYAIDPDQFCRLCVAVLGLWEAGGE